MSSPYNTSRINPLLLLAESMGAGGSGTAIERMEMQGQREFVNSSVLPSRLNHGSEDELTTLGFTFGDKVDGDPLFRHATLPPGWKREGSEHAMWSHIVDELGRKRVSVFYKAAVYDRDAFLNIVSVYGYVGDCITDGTQPILDETWATHDAVREAAAGWLKRNTEYLEMYEGRDDDYGRDRVTELRSEIDACQAVIDAHEEIAR
ncbi:hypothetical protein ACFWYW_57570 [Nonomuraea sp. NPDC059023]|uniref:hypothetical protein n=1 Tax=unclassified Nonomuraea TaxID=2593643 RepID=UPI003687CCA3